MPPSPHALSGVLRNARSELIPAIPTLATQLTDNPHVIRDAICDAVSRQDVDPDEISWQGLNKTERHTIAGFAIGVQRDF